MFFNFYNARVSFEFLTQYCQSRQHILCAVLRKIHTNRGNQLLVRNNLNCAETDSLSVFNEHYLRISNHMLFREVWFALFPEGF